MSATYAFPKKRQSLALMPSEMSEEQYRRSFSAEICDGVYAGPPGLMNIAEDMKVLTLGFRVHPPALLDVNTWCFCTATAAGLPGVSPQSLVFLHRPSIHDTANTAWIVAPQPDLTCTKPPSIFASSADHSRLSGAGDHGATREVASTTLGVPGVQLNPSSGSGGAAYTSLCEAIQKLCKFSRSVLHPNMWTEGSMVHLVCDNDPAPRRALSAMPMLPQLVPGAVVHRLPVDAPHVQFVHALSVPATGEPGAKGPMCNMFVFGFVPCVNVWLLAPLMNIWAIVGFRLEALLAEAAAM